MLILCVLLSRGYFQTAEQRYLIEPLSEDSDGDHAVLKYENVTNTPMVCGVTNTSWEPSDRPPYISKSKSRSSVSRISSRVPSQFLILMISNQTSLNA